MSELIPRIFLFFLNSIQNNHIHSFLSSLLSFSVSRANLSCVVATIFSSLTFLSSSFSMANMSHMVAASFCSIVLYGQPELFASDTISCLSFLSNSFSSPRFNLLRVVRRCFSWSSVSDDLFFPLVVFVLLLVQSFSCLIFSLSFLCSSVSEARFALSLFLISK